MRSHIGIYSGTFDPIHKGHVAFAQAALQACRLDKVVFLPEYKPRNKHDVTDISHRLTLIERALGDNPFFSILDLDTEQFTVKQTLPKLRSLFGGAHLTFLIGSDVVQTFLYRWEGLDVLFREVSLAVGMRVNDDPSEVTRIMAAMEETYGNPIDYTCISTPSADIASSQIRAGLTDPSHIPHPSVLGYIHEHGLYAKNGSSDSTKARFS